jgi:glycine cleavage system H lipoate-binding protein
MFRIVFLGVFSAVAVIVACTVINAILRARRALRHGEVDHIRWHGDFEDLSSRDRICRHVLTGELQSRQCPNAFDCRECETHGKLLERHPLPAAPRNEEDMFGMSFPLDRFYHRGHTWARLDADGNMTIGLDDLGRRLLGAPDSVELPHPGERIETNGTAFRVRRNGVEVRVLAPVDGTVMEASGLGMRVRPDSLNLAHLLRGSEVRPWLMRELERLQGQSLADGGVPVEADAETVAEMFLEP